MLELPAELMTLPVSRLLEITCLYCGLCGVAGQSEFFYEGGLFIGHHVKRSYAMSFLPPRRRTQYSRFIQKKGGGGRPPTHGLPVFVAPVEAVPSRSGSLTHQGSTIRWHCYVL